VSAGIQEGAGIAQREGRALSASPLTLLASAPRGLADLLARELVELGASEVRERSTAVAFSGALEVAYRACLHSRIANRVLLELARFEAATTEAFYGALREIDWSAHLAPGATLACDFTGRHPTITHTHFGALRLKDAICDTLRATSGERPQIARERPSVRVHAHAEGARVRLSLDLSGESLHRRGYRGEAGAAPLKENVAAGVLIRAGWPALAAAGAPFLDPLCGAGTLVIEAALIAAHIAPGLRREYFGFLGWRGHDPALWDALRAQAIAQAQAAAPPPRPLRGEDRDPQAIARARDNARSASVADLVQFESQALRDAAPRPGEEGGLVCTNPPYGVRLSDESAARETHAELGRVLRARFQGWHAAVLTGAPALGLALGLRAHRTHTLWNGAIECRLLRIEVGEESEREVGRLGKSTPEATAASPGALMFANRVAKNLKRLGRWAQREGISCLRIYDADMPEYAFAIDRYRTCEPQQDWLYVQEYAAPAEIEAEAVRRRRAEALAALPGVSAVPSERIRLRTRRRQRGAAQYEKLGAEGRFHVIAEGGLRFWVNFEDYLDTGLFLDHRLTRAYLRDHASGARFLNLFAYTGTASVYAAAGRAAASTSVDLSRTYLEWARRNLQLNGFGGAQHQLVQADAREWLNDAAGRGERYELIFLDPPTFSNSKRMQGVLDIGRDHPALIDACMRLLAAGGRLVFSTNAQRFSLDPELKARYDVRDLSALTLPKDFERNPRIHRCFELQPH